MSPVFALPVNDSRCGGFLTFSDTSWGPISVALSVSHDQRLPVNLSRFFSRPIDRSYRIDHLSSFFLSFARSLRFFNWLFSTSLFRSLFSTFLLALSLAQKLSMEQQEICVRHDVFCNCLSFRSAFVLLVTLFPMVTEPDTTAGSSDQQIFQLICIRFVYSSFDDYRVLFRARPPLQLRSLCIRDTRQRRSVLFLFNKIDLTTGMILTAWICNKRLKYDSTTWQFWIRVGKRPWCISFYSLWVLRRFLEAERSATILSCGFRNPWYFRFIWKIYIYLSRNSRLKMRMILRSYSHRIPLVQ